MFDPVWKCKDGRQLKISAMELSHIKFAIAMIERGNGWRRQFLERLKLELVIRGIKNG